MVFTPNQELLNQYNLTLTDFQTQLSAYIGGVTLGINSNQPVPSPAQVAMTSGVQVGQVQAGEIVIWNNMTTGLNDIYFQQLSI